MNRFARTILIVSTAAATLPRLHAQTDSLLYITPSMQVAPEGKGELRGTVDAMLFMRDNEYKSSMVKGYTLPGMWLAPTLSYQPLRNLKIEAGAYLLHFWGANRYPIGTYRVLPDENGGKTTRAFHALPVVRANMQLTHNFNIVLGTLYGKSDHGLIEPLYNEEHNLSSDPEAGVQFLWNLPWMKLDAWVSWEDFIFRNDDRQESFVFGLSTRFRPSRRKARAQWYIPVQAVFRHEGGEINPDAEDRSVKTWLNAATGAGVRIPLRTKVPASLNFEGMVAYYSQQSGTALPYDDGFGLYAEASARVWRFGITAGYWYCHDFISILGNPLYGAASIEQAQTLIDKPHTLTARVEYAQQLGKGFSFAVHADLLNQFKAREYTPDTGWTQGQSACNFAAGISLRVRPEWVLRK